MTDPAIGPHNIEACLDRLIAAANDRATTQTTVEEEAAQAVFAGAFIPRRLDEVAHFERDAARLADGRNTEGIYWQTVTGMEADPSKGVRTQPVVLQEPAGSAAAAPVMACLDEAEAAASSSGSSSDDEESGDAPHTWANRPGAPSREEIRAARRANKVAVKGENKEKRTKKIPKHKKNAAVRKSSGKK